MKANRMVSERAVPTGRSRQSWFLSRVRCGSRLSCFFQSALVAILVGHFVRHHGKARQRRGSKGRGYCDIRCITTAGDHNTSDAGMVMAGIEGEPASVEENLEP